MTEREEELWKKKLAFMRWLCLPERRKIKKKSGEYVWEDIPIFRDPPTIEGIAERLGVSRKTLYEWQAQPEFKQQYQKMSIQVLLDTEPEVNRVKLRNMLRPQGWQERLGHDRYTKPLLYQIAAQGYLDDIQPRHAIAEGDKQQNRERAMSLFDQLPRETKQQVLAFLEGIEAIAPEPGTAQLTGSPTGTGYIVEGYAEPQEISEDEAILTEIKGMLGKPERKVNLGPDEDED